MLSKKLEKFAKLLEHDQIENLIKTDCYCIPNLENIRVNIIDGKKYIKVDLRSSGRYMIDKTTQEIYGIKAYGQINKSHYYGTLDTISKYNWGTHNGRLLKEARKIDNIELKTVDKEILKLENINLEYTPDEKDLFNNIVIEEGQQDSQSNNVIDFMEWKRRKAV